MSHRKKLEFVQRILGGACLATMVACAPAASEHPSASYGQRDQAVGSNTNLSSAEWSTYRADIRYLHGLVNPDVRVRLNLADARQHRFVQARLKLAGKTPKNSPYLFEALAAHRQTHLARGYKAGQVAELADSDTVERTEMHFIEAASMGENTPAPNDGLGAAASTVPEGAWYTWVDVGMSDASGLPIGDMTWIEEFDGGHNVPIRAVGDLSQTNLSRYIVSSFKMEDAPAGFFSSYLYTEMGAEDEFLTAAAITRDVTVDAPLDIKFNDNLISVCLNRTWTQDCDYDLTGAPQAVKLPLKGSVTLTSDHVFNTARINQIRTDVLANRPPADAGQARLVLTNVGGGCQVTDGNVQQANMKPFWSAATVTVNGKTLSWDATAANAMHFSDGCRQVQDRVKLSVTVRLPLLTVPDNQPAYTVLGLSSENGLDYTFKPITVTNSCLAEGTQIQLAGGALAPIESLQSGAQVFNPYDRDDQALTVTDTAKGFETVPMVRIRDAAGRDLLLTEMHPISTPDRGMVQARALRTGDQVMTQSGPSKLVEVSREPYGGQVYNLKVGAEAEVASLGVDQTVVYANGFVVGDGQIQSKYETLAMTQKEGDVLDRLPAQWHRDYLLSQQRK